VGPSGTVVAVKTLVIAELYPWPAVDGYRQRLDHVLRGLARAGEVSLFCLHRPGQPEPAPCPIEGVGPVVVHRAGPDVPALRRTAAWVRSSAPRRLLVPDWSAAREELTRWEPQPDLIWFSLVDTWHATHDLFEGIPSICDFDNLENLAIRLRRRTPPRVAPGSGPAARLRAGARWVASRSADLLDERRWHDEQLRCASSVDRVVVCSTLDVQRSEVADAVAVPNGADEPDGVDADRRALRGSAPTMLFVGALDYEPNSDAVAWMAREVLPTVRAHRPDAVFRVVGRGAERVQWAADLPGVELAGAVPSIREELDRADVSVVPIRVGAGTRLKVVEAMAHRIPLVTTTVGCEGIDLLDGEHALVADDSRRFADACLRSLADGELRQRLADSAAELFHARYTWTSIGEQVAALAQEVAGCSVPSDGC
jgi:glycosyltransferase involved in cell wall biosynthesis